MNYKDWAEGAKDALILDVIRISIESMLDYQKVSGKKKVELERDCEGMNRMIYKIIFGLAKSPQEKKEIRECIRYYIKKHKKFFF